ncbi:MULTISPECIES: Dyp-type peroxidase [Chryseobacterium]|uniref:Dyp-type peroxidase n=1 Tax=Chryseobacterium TaxID=59732 RepID=UPI00195E1D1F|nr:MULTISPECIES: Dyp-type peroxidase [Chryseobacterium]MBM7420271.1 putative iron-dependent peroxidase [Chryseobacterium sp. JUb44]MDH6210215.1 putative iron-dependent peroxidase [Chryseobacterium sp. BIGb0186]WSO08932.1 Dyp-type peroxidase [Chryseobacterium scophthalmum]
MSTNNSFPKNYNSQNVTDYPNNNTYFLVWNFKENIDSAKIKSVFQRVCALVINLNNSALDRFPNSRASCVMGIGYEAWLQLDLPKPLPKEFKIFEEIKGEKHTAVSTKGDLHFHIRADEKSYAYDMSSIISGFMKDIADCIVEVHGFRYWDGRSILGFVDGTENPHGKDRDYFAVIGDSDLQYQGGSYLFVQKYIHNLNAWTTLSVDQQEKVMGRSKDNDIEMSDDIKPSNSHIALANVGDDFKVVRDNMPFGNISTNEMGTYFICYANTFTTVEKMLTNMFVGNPIGNYDRILDFSTAHTGTLFFAPSADMLDDFSG